MIRPRDLRALAFHLTEMIAHGLPGVVQFLGDVSVENRPMLCAHCITGRCEKKPSAVFEIQQIEKMLQGLHRNEFAGNLCQREVKMPVVQYPLIQIVLHEITATYNTIAFKGRHPTQKD